MDAKIMEIRLQQWVPIFEAQASSGLTKEAWCKENGIPRWQFFRKQKELRQYMIRNDCDTTAPEKKAEVFPAAFVEIPNNTAMAKNPFIVSEAVSEGQIAISYHGFSISLTGAVDASTLETLIRSIANV